MNHGHDQGRGGGEEEEAKKRRRKEGRVLSKEGSRKKGKSYSVQGIARSTAMLAE